VLWQRLVAWRTKSNVEDELAEELAKSRQAESTWEEQEGRVEELSRTKKATAGGRERRRYPRHGLNTGATLYLLRPLATVETTIVDLSLGGCRLHLQRRIPLDIRIRIEVGFVYGGLPFRVGGVIQAVHTQEEIGVRFIDLSERNQRRLYSLIAEVQRDSQQKAAEPKFDAGAVA
jgi:hypothetical protein